MRLYFFLYECRCLSYRNMQNKELETLSRERDRVLKELMAIKQNQNHAKKMNQQDSSLSKSTTVYGAPIIACFLELGFTTYRSSNRCGDR